MSRGWMIPILAVALGLSGCQRTEPISKYKVARPQAKARVERERPPPLKGEPARFLAAMYPAGDKMWFFRLTGPSQVIDPVAEEFEAWIRTVQVGAGAAKPTWKLPEGWVELPGKESTRDGITVKIVAYVQLPDDQARAEVSALDNPDFYRSPKGLLFNLNRWGRLVNRGPFDVGDLDGLTRTVKAGDTEVILVDIEGHAGRGGALPPGHPPVGPVARGELPFEAKMPSEWTLLLGGPQGIIRIGQGIIFFTEGNKATWSETLKGIHPRLGEIPAGELKAQEIEIGSKQVEAVEFKDMEMGEEMAGWAVRYPVGDKVWVFVLLTEPLQMRANRVEMERFLESISEKTKG